MCKVSVAIIGFGNIGRHALDALEEGEDFKIAGIVEQHEFIAKIRLAVNKYPVVDDITKLGKVDLALLCIPSLHVREYAKQLLQKGINTVDCYDLHGDSLLELVDELEIAAQANQVVAISGVGWDPGTDSLVRAIFEIMSPQGITYTNFGPGMSMGHTVEVKKYTGVRNAVSLTVPKGFGLHKRMVYVELEDGVDVNLLEQEIKGNPYFRKDETYVIEVQDVRKIMDHGHGVVIERKGIAGKTHNQRMEFSLNVSNPALTAQIMVSVSRAIKKRKPGAYILLDIPLIDILPGARRDNIQRIV